MLGVEPTLSGIEGEAQRLRREWYGSRSGERQRQPGEHREAGVKLDALQAADAERCKTVLVLEAPELLLD